MLTLVKLAETVRCALNDAHGDADFFNDFIAPLVTAGKIKNKEKEHTNKKSCNLRSWTISLFIPLLKFFDYLWCVFNCSS